MQHCSTKEEEEFKLSGNDVRKYIRRKQPLIRLRIAFSC